MSKFDEALETYQKQMTEKIGMKKVDKKLLHAVAKGLGPSIYRADASKVSCSNKDEMDRVKKNFLIKKLGLKDGPKLDEALKDVCKEMGSSNRNKYRAIFYYMLVKKFRKSSVYADKM